MHDDVATDAKWVLMWYVLIIVFKERRLSVKAGWASGASQRLGFGSKARRSARRRSSSISTCALGERGPPWKGGEARSRRRTGHGTMDWDCCGDDGLGAGRLHDRLGLGRSRAPTGVRATDWALGEAILAAGQRRERERRWWQLGNQEETED
jgi:hypothetical protein